MSYAIGATAAVDADRAYHESVGTKWHVSRPRRKTGLSAVTLTAKYKTVDGTISFADRWMSVLPVRV